jgi:hypothetical protein
LLKGLRFGLSAFSILHPPKNRTDRQAYSSIIASWYFKQVKHCGYLLGYQAIGSKPQQ